MIPDDQTLMLPLLKIAADGKEHRVGDLIEPLGKILGLAETDMAAMLPSGTQTVFSNRVHWAKTYSRLCALRSSDCVSRIATIGRKGQLRGPRA
jgi:restriction system protein